jgi:hypothetical protein
MSSCSREKVFCVLQKGGTKVNSLNTGVLVCTWWTKQGVEGKNAASRLSSCSVPSHPFLKPFLWGEIALWLRPLRKRKMFCQWLGPCNRQWRHKLQAFSKVCTSFIVFVVINPEKLVHCPTLLPVWTVSHLHIIITPLWTCIFRNHIL